MSVADHNRPGAREVNDLLQKIQHEQTPPGDGGDELSRQQEEEYRNNERRASLEVQDYENQIQARDVFRYRLFYLMVAWIAVVLSVTIADGCNLPSDPAQFAFPLYEWIGFWTLLGITVVALVGMNRKYVLYWLRRTRGGGAWLVFIAIAWSLFPLLAVVIAWLRPVSLLNLAGAWLDAFDLSDNLILALIGSTTANVIGLFVIVARHLFPGTDKSKLRTPPKK